MCCWFLGKVDFPEVRTLDDFDRKDPAVNIIDFPEVITAELCMILMASTITNNQTFLETAFLEVHSSGEIWFPENCLWKSASQQWESEPLTLTFKSVQKSTLY